MEESAKTGHPSFALVREKASSPKNQAYVLEKKLPIIPLQHILLPVIKITLPVVISIQCIKRALKITS